MMKYILQSLLALLLLAGQAQALELEDFEDGKFPGVAADTEPLSADEAFTLRVLRDTPGRYLLDFIIEDGYYLYHHRMGISPEPISVEFSDNREVQTDQFFGEQEVYRIYASGTLELPTGVDEFLITYQGCWDGGICYPTEQRQVSTKDGEVTLTEVAFDVTGDGISFGTERNYTYYLNYLGKAESWWLLLLIFFLAGLGLTFTPCVLPMLPILSGIITQRNTQDNKNNTRRQVYLALTYVGVMSITFSILGLLSGIIGYGLRELLGSQIFLLAMGVLITSLALSMLNLLKLRLPTAISQPLNDFLAIKQGGYRQAAIWGFFSPFIVGTCLSAPLAAAMIYLAEQGSPWLGALSLLALSWGMGLPMLLFALGLGQLLPASGPWLGSVQRLFAVLLLGLAVFIISPLLPLLLQHLAYILLFCWGLYLLASLWLADSKLKLWGRGTLGLAVILVAAYFFLLPQAYRSSPLAGFTVVSDYASFEQALSQAQQVEQPQLLYYYADWCISCRELEWTVFSDPEVKAKMKQFDLVKVDVTRSNSDTRRLTAEYNILGPPTVIFLARDGLQVKQFTLIGNFDKSSLLSRLQAIAGPTGS